MTINDIELGLACDLEKIKEGGHSTRLSRTSLIVTRSVDDWEKRTQHGSVSTLVRIVLHQNRVLFFMLPVSFKVPNKALL